MSRGPAIDPRAIDRSRRVRPIEGTPVRRAEGSGNPTFGPAYWSLGLGAATPALLGALALLSAGARLPLLPRLPAGMVLGLLLGALALGVVVVHRLDYPAWSHPGVALVPALGLFLPVAVWHGQVVVRINGDPDPVVVVPLAITWLLLVAAALVTAIVALIVGRQAPSFSGIAVLPLPLILAWTLVLVPGFREERVIGALASACMLLAWATFIAWIVPTGRRPLVPLVAIGLQFATFWALRLRPPTFGGALRPIIWLDLVLYVVLVALVGLAPACAGWVRRAGWPEIRRLLHG